MSAWFVLAASGLHPIAGADGRYEITSPSFDKISFRLDEAYATGKEFTVVARNNSPAHPYIQSIKLNGTPYHKSYLTHATISQGGELVLEMGDKPVDNLRSEEHTSELQSLMRTSYAVSCLNKKNKSTNTN